MGATVGGGDGSRNAAVAGQQDHPAKGEVLADRLNQVEAIIVAQVLVQNRAVQRGVLGGELRDQLQCLLAIMGHMDLGAMAAQRPGGLFSEQVVVFYQQQLTAERGVVHDAAPGLSVCGQ